MHATVEETDHYTIADTHYVLSLALWMSFKLYIVSLFMPNQECVFSHLHLSSLIFFKDKAELLRIRTCYQSEKKRSLTQRKLLEQI